MKMTVNNFKSLMAKDRKVKASKQKSKKDKKSKKQKKHGKETEFKGESYSEQPLARENSFMSEESPDQ
jgi:hypothetical protein